MKLSSFKIQNIVASNDVGFSIKLESLKEYHEKFSRCHYEPELFPGLIYKMEVPRVVLLIFTSGKIVLAGAKSRQEIYKAYFNIYPILVQFQKKQSVSQLEQTKRQLLRHKAIVDKQVSQLTKQTSKKDKPK